MICKELSHTGVDRCEIIAQISTQGFNRIIVGIYSVFKTSEVLRLWNLNSSCGVYSVHCHDENFPIVVFFFCVHLKGASM